MEERLFMGGVMDLELVELFKKNFLELIENHDETISLPTPNEYGDELDRAQEDRDNLLILRLKGRDDFYIKKVKEALIRIENNSFGICEECGNEIELNRLYARPVATLCMSCKEVQEREEGHILYHKRSHTYGKALIVDNPMPSNFVGNLVD